MTCREKILSEEYYDIIADNPLSQEMTENYDLCFTDIDGVYNFLYINRIGIPPLNENFIEYRNIPNLYGLMQFTATSGEQSVFDSNNLIKSGILQIQRSPLNLTGRGVVLCFIDTGINFAQDVFRDAEGNTRILSIWDQTIQDGTPPEGFLFGTEYSAEEINAALKSEAPYEVVPSFDTNGHGSALAAVAAGSVLGGGYEYIGAAPDADIVVVKLKEAKAYLRDFYHVPENVPAYQENDIMLAVSYVQKYVEYAERPVVICMGLGTNMGNHAGDSPLSVYLTLVSARRNVAVLVCGGNEGNSAHHFRGRLPKRNDGASSNENVELRVGENCRGFYMELWGITPDVYNLTIRSPGGEMISPLRLSVSQSITYSFVYERSRVTIASSFIEATSGEQLIRFRFTDPSPGLWTLNVFSVGEVDNGEFNIWLPVTEFLDSEVYFLSPDPFTTMTEPALANIAIGVSTYNAENDSFFTESGRGFGTDGVISPAFAAPGVNVSLPWGSATGSGMAVAFAAGAAAQFMQWAVVQGNDVNAETRELKNYLIRGASRDATLSYPSRTWGYGRLNMLGTFEALINI